MVENEDFVAFVPFCARFPYETMVLPRQHVPSILELTNAQRWRLAARR